MNLNLTVATGTAAVRGRSDRCVLTGPLIRPGGLNTPTCGLRWIARRAWECTGRGTCESTNGRILKSSSRRILGCAHVLLRPTTIRPTQLGLTHVLLIGDVVLRSCRRTSAAKIIHGIRTYVLCGRRMPCGGLRVEASIVVSEGLQRRSQVVNRSRGSIHRTWRPVTQ
jgi:hypothetical protein